MAQVIWSAQAIGNLNRIYEFIEVDAYAQRFLIEMISKTELQLITFPESGRKVPEFSNSPLSYLREVIFQGYRIIYDIRQLPKEVIVIAVVHGRMDLPSHAEAWII